MIYGKLSIFVLGGLLAVAGLLSGCGKTAAPQAPSSAPAESANPKSESLKLHWLGKKQLATDTNAAQVLDLWKLPESVRLETQTLDKLATAPWRLWAGVATAVSNAPSSLLRPLLDDLVQEETYLEMQSRPEGDLEIVLAVRLPADRAALWQSNLPAIWQSLSAAVATNTTIARTNDWTFVSLVSSSRRSTLAPRLLDEVLARLATHGTPHEPRATNYWVELNLGTSATRLLAGKRHPAGTNWPAVHLFAYGDGDTVRTRGTVDLGQPLDLTLEPWAPPTNTMFGPLISFSAVRGVRPWLEAQPFWQERNLGTAPNQAFFWAQSSAPWLHFFGATSGNAETQFLALKDYILETVNPALAPNRTGEFAWLTNENRVVWKGVPFFNPQFARQGDLITGGLVPNNVTNRPIPSEFLEQLALGTNLVYYDWEHTGPQMQSWTQIGQLLRMTFSRAQLPPTNAVIPWLQKVAPQLGFSATAVRLENPRHLTLARSATLGFNSTELHLVLDWLASPDFPRGLHTFVAKREFVMDRTRRTPPTSQP